MDPDLVPYGYAVCRCGEWVLAGVKMCEKCASAVSRGADEVLVIDVQGKPVLNVRPPTRPKRRKRDPEVPPAERTMVDRARDRARTRAWVRLAQIYEPMFVALYTEEQLREGIEPVPIPPMQRDPYDMLLRDLEEYRERSEATFAAAEPTLGDERPA